MGKDTNIQWCDSTVNPTTGCDGCELWKLLEARADMLRKMGGTCYAGNFHEGRLARSLPDLYAADFTEVRMVPGRMAKAAAWSDLTGTARPDKPWLDGSPRVIFIGDMGDVLSEAVTFDYLKTEMIDVVISAKGRRHVWMLLTKRPGRLVEFADWLKAEYDVDWPANLWPGTSITGKASLKRVDALLKVPSDRRFLSVEPLIEAVDLGPWLWCRDCGDKLSSVFNYCPGGHRGSSCCPAISLVIVGGESGPNARPFNLAWARSIRDQCKAARVPFFMKQMGSNPFVHLYDHAYDPPRPSGGMYSKYRDSHGGDMDEWPEDLRVREFPRSEVTVGDR